MAANSVNPAAELGPALVPWWLEWRGECVAIVGAGPSAKQVPLDILRDRIHVIAISESYKLVPWADALYSCDYAWWHHNRGVKDFAGLRLSHDRRACDEYGLRHVAIDLVGANDLCLDKPSHVGAGGNSGFQAFNLAVQFGVTGIILIGIDCSGDHGLHWHGRHPMPMSNPMEYNFKRWAAAFDGAASRLQALGVDVVNCSTISRLTRYPIMTIPEALERWQL